MTLGDLPRQAVTEPWLLPGDLRVLLLIVSRSDPDGWCRLRKRYMAETLGVHRDTIIAAVKRLCLLGYLEALPQRRPDGGSAPTIYRVLHPCRTGPTPGTVDRAIKTTIRLAGRFAGIEPVAIVAGRKGNAMTVLARQIAEYLSVVGLDRHPKDVAPVFGRDRSTIEHNVALVEDRRDCPVFDAEMGRLEEMLPGVWVG